MASTAEAHAVVREVMIAASPETIWRFLVNPADAVRWMGVGASLDPRPGGAYRVEVLPGDVASGEFVELDRPRRLVHTWGWESPSGSVPPGSTTVAFDLIPRGAGTLVRVTHSRLPQGVATAPACPRLGALPPPPGGAGRGRRSAVDPWIARRPKL